MPKEGINVNGLNRRGFLRLAGLSVAAVVLAACAPKVEPGATPPPAPKEVKPSATSVAITEVEYGLYKVKIEDLMIRGNKEYGERARLGNNLLKEDWRCEGIGGGVVHIGKDKPAIITSDKIKYLEVIGDLKVQIKQGEISDLHQWIDVSTVRPYCQFLIMGDVVYTGTDSGTIHGKPSWAIEYQTWDDKELLSTVHFSNYITHSTYNSRSGRWEEVELSAMEPGVTYKSLCWFTQRGAKPLKFYQSRKILLELGRASVANEPPPDTRVEFKNLRVIVFPTEPEAAKALGKFLQ